MASRYSVIRYLPDPLSGECINIGVIAFDEAANIVRVRFLSQWQRVEGFGKVQDMPFLHDFVQRMEKAVSEGLLYPGDSGIGSMYERLSKIAVGWINSIQFTPPAASLDDVESLLQAMVKAYLVQGESG